MRYRGSLSVGLLLISFGAGSARAESPKTAGESLSSILGEISSSEFDRKSLPTSDPGFFSVLKLFSSSFLQVTFTHSSDEMPVARPKLIHTYGSVAPVELIIDAPSSPYTGLFKTGGVGLARLSLAKQSGSFTPGMGLKLFVDYKPSINFQVMYSLDGQGEDRNFFVNKFSNIIDPPSSFILKQLGNAFDWAINALSDNPSEKPESAIVLPVYEAAGINSDGTAVASDSIVEPYEVVFTPTSEVKKSYASFLSRTQNAVSYDKDFRVGLGEIPAGTVLYTVSVKAKRGAQEEVIGRLKTSGKFIASEYGDSKLFFQHQKHRNPKDFRN